MCVCVCVCVCVCELIFVGFNISPSEHIDADGRDESGSDSGVGMG